MAGKCSTAESLAYSSIISRPILGTEEAKENDNIYLIYPPIRVHLGPVEHFLSKSISFFFNYHFIQINLENPKCYNLIFCMSD